MEKSESIKAIGKALGLFQLKMQPIKKDASNPFFKSKYASLSTILDNIQIPMEEAGLSYAQFPDGECLTTILMHPESGEFMQACFNIHAVKQDPQAIGSAITYARRYALGAILGLNIDEDDDANAATIKPEQQEASKYPKQNTAVNENELPWLDEKGFNAALKRINANEEGIFEKTKQNFRIKKAYRDTLEQATKNLKSV